MTRKSVRKSKKVATTTTSAKPASRKLLIVSTKKALGKDMQDMNVRKV